MKITLKWLKEKNACSGGIEWFNSQNKSELNDVLFSLLESKKFSWANWTICSIFNHKQKVQYAVYAAEQVLELFEKKYPKDDRPRKAIESAKKWIDNPCATAANASADAATAADDKEKIQKKIINYGLKLISEQEAGK